MERSETIEKDQVPHLHDGFENLFQIKLFTSLANDSEISASDAVASFLKHTAEETLFYKGGHTSWGWAVFSCLMEVAKRTTPVEKLDKLVQFIIQLQKIKLYDPETGEQLINDHGPSWKFQIWDGLPQFGWAASDELNFGGEDARGNRHSPEEFQRNENLVTFLARLSTATETPYTDDAGPATDYTYWALHDFRNLFREPHFKSIDKKWCIRIWCLWLIHGAERMLTNIQHEPCFPKTRDKDHMQMRPEDWEAWRKETLAARPAYGDRVKEMIDAAMKSMDRAEAKHGIPFRLGP